MRWVSQVSILRSGIGHRQTQIHAVKDLAADFGTWDRQSPQIKKHPVTGAGSRGNRMNPLEQSIAVPAAPLGTGTEVIQPQGEKPK
jgi:hypothetical protein